MPNLYDKGTRKAEQDYIQCDDCTEVVLNTIAGIDIHLQRHYLRKSLVARMAAKERGAFC